MHLKTALLGAAASVALTGAAFGQSEGERGRDGQLNIIYWQAPSTLNPYLSGGTKEVESGEPRPRAARPVRRERRDGAVAGGVDPDDR